jgi:predicted kinase
MSPTPTLVLFTGPPGTGKSTLAGVAAGVPDAPVLGWDWAMAGLSGFESLQAAMRAMDVGTYRSVGWSILWNLATAQLRRGSSVVLDGVARTAEVARTRELADSEGASAVVVATSCADPELHRSRVEGRTRGTPGWHELTWDHVSRAAAGWDPPPGVDPHLDAASPLDANIARLMERIRAGDRPPGGDPRADRGAR